MEKKRIAGVFRRLTALGLAGGLLWCGGTQVDAATLKDVFDDHYYADTYEDLKAAFGYDREALWNHYVNFGLNEGRGMNGLIDVVKYREQYADLDAAFGDDWDAYVNHYLTFGTKEGRANGTGNGFNALDYAAGNADVRAAFGDDVLAIWKHYQAAGIQEASSGKVIEAQKAEAAQKPQEIPKPQDLVRPQEFTQPQEIPQPQANPQPVAYTERTELTFWGMYRIDEYNESGKMLRRTNYYETGGISACWEFEYYEGGNKSIYWSYDRDGILEEWSVGADYGDGKFSTGKQYSGNGTLTRGAISEYYENGKIKIHIEIDRGGYEEREYDENGNLKVQKRYESDGNGVYQFYSSSVAEVDESGWTHQTIHYADGTVNTIIYKSVL